jgi:hypothetical protein
MGQDRGPLRLAKTVISNGLSNLPSLHKDQGGLKADLKTVKDRLGNLWQPWRKSHDSTISSRLKTDLATYDDHEGSPTTPRSQVG